MNPMPNDYELRRRFAIWSLAIFGSITGSGNVRLESSAWGAEDPPTESKSQLEKKGDGAAAPLDRAAFQQLLDVKDFQAAAKMVDEALANHPDGNSLYLSYLLANAMVNAKDPAGMARIESVAKQATAAMEDSPSPQVFIAYSMSHQRLASKLASEKQTSQAIDLLKEAWAKLEAKKAPQSSALVSTLVSLLLHEGRSEEAKAMASVRLDAAIAAAQKNSTVGTRVALGSAFSQFVSSIGAKFPADAQKAHLVIEPILRAAVESDDCSIADYTAYLSTQTNLAVATVDSDAPAAVKLLETTKELRDKLSERLEAADKDQFNSSQKMLAGAESRIKSKLLHHSLIGQPAPEFEIEAAVNMPKVNWADLKGKVVLLDFWAVWCGPCIATFPHLQEWKKQYGDKGLVIVGVTRQYGYKWDKEQGRQVKEEGTSLEVELEMLEEFRKAHALEHGFVVTPKESDYNRKLGVSGIPQAVLVDQNGVIQLIRVGSQESNAEDLEAKIKSLLGV